MEKQLTITSGDKVAVMGLGVSGRAAANYALKQGAEVLVSDTRPLQKLLAEESELAGCADVRWEAGEHTVKFLAQADVVIVSPGISSTTGLMDALRARGVQVAGELAFVAGTGKPIVAITGTNGKTTVTTLIGQLLKKAGKRAFVGGNIGVSLFDYLSDPSGFDVLVLEVSSFQLESAGGFSPDVAILLNITPDHLDRHGSFVGYCAEKMKLFSHQQSGDLAIVNGDDPYCTQLPEKLLSNIQMFGHDHKFACDIMGSDVVLQRGGEREIYSLTKTQFDNHIGASNCAPAILAARSLGCSKRDINAVLQGFSPMEHRLEYVTELSGVTYYNDSKATNTGAVSAALNQFDNKVILIAGGRDKGDDYSLLRSSISEKVKTLIVLGESAKLLQQSLLGVTEIIRAASMQDAVQRAAGLAVKGDTVLLSPACASFDMFTGYAQRGRVFKREVAELEKTASKGDL